MSTQATISKTFIEEDGTETAYMFSLTGDTLEEVQFAMAAYGSAIEYARLLDEYVPKDMLFIEADLFQHIQPATYEQLLRMNPSLLERSYKSAYAFVSTYAAGVYDIDSIEPTDTTAAANTLRLALCMATAMFMLGSAPNHAETTRQMEFRLQDLLAGLRRGQRHMGDPLGHRTNVGVVSLGKK